jgi:lysozyme
MKPSQACIDLVKRFEGCHLEAYTCPAGLPTIGYGHTRGVKLGERISIERAEQLLAEDLGVAARAVEKALRVPVTQGQFDALCSFAFNCRGWSKSTLLKLVNAGDSAAASREFPKWVHAGGTVLKGLVKRRAAEQQLFLA